MSRYFTSEGRSARQSADSGDHSVAGLARRFRREQRARLTVGGTAALLLAIVWSHSLAGVLRAFDPGAPPMARSLTVAAILVAGAGMLSRSQWITLGFGALAVAWMQAFFPGTLLVSLAVPAAGAAAVAAGLWLAEHLPGDPSRYLRRKPLVAAAWLLLAVASVVQVGRLSTWMTDPEFDWFGTTRHPFWAQHECLPAYVYGAELVARGEFNPWDADHYPGLNPQAEPSTKLTAMAVEDPYQYTPQFLLLPSLALHLTDHYPAIRLGWYGVQTTLFLAVALWLASWVAAGSGTGSGTETGTGRNPLGLVAGYFLPLTLVAIPTLHSLQYGQFHLAALVLAVAGMLCLEPDADGRSRRGWGGALLATSILAKIFPAVLLLPLAVQKRWRDLASVALWGLVATILAVGVYGPDVFASFFGYHLPRLGSGEAFAFGEAWPEVRELLIAANHGAYGLVTKLGEMGVAGMTAATAARVGKAFLLAVLVLAAIVGVRLTGASRARRAVAWISLLGLASMASAGAFADYVPVAFAWLLPFLLFDLAQSRGLSAFFAVVAFFQFTLLGAAPWGTWAPARWTMPLSALSVVLLLAAYSLALRAAALPSPAEADARDDGAQGDQECESESAATDLTHDDLAPSAA